jgi:uncharacterized protein (UPF0335 family)
VTAEIGDNSVPAARDKLKALIAQIVHTEREKEGLSTDISEYYASAKEEGFNVKALRLAVKRSVESPTKKADREKIESISDQYLSASGMLD